MNKFKLLLFIVATVILLNVILISFLFLGKKAGPRERIQPREIIIQKLHFDDAQIEAYEITIHEHQKAIRDIDDAIREQKNELYSLLKNNSTEDKKADSIIANIADLQKEIEKTHYKHFLEIRKICTDKQLKDYNTLTEELSQIFSHPKRPMHER